MIITLLRKPLEGTVAENTLKHGCGALNIDETRISFDSSENINFDARQRQQTASYKESGWSGHVAQVGSDIQMFKEKGRWPANFILTHLDGCELKGTKKVKGSVGKDSEGNEAKTGISMNNSTGGIRRVSHADEDGKETVANWDCVEGCPVKELDQQSGNRKTTWVSASHKNNRQGDFLGALGHSKDQGYNDEGGSSRFFKQFKGS
jgi:hypothetical protein